MGNDASSTISVTDDGMTRLECFADDPHGELVAELNAGTSWDSLPVAVRSHEVEHGCGRVPLTVEREARLLLNTAWSYFWKHCPDPASQRGDYSPREDLGDVMSRAQEIIDGRP